PVLVDHSEPHKAPGKPGASVRHDLLACLLLQPAGLAGPARSPLATLAAAQVASAGVLPAGLTNLLVENTTFGISFIGAAKTSAEKGQCAAMSRNVRLPMMCTPARHTFSMVQAVASLSRLLKIQSSSPFGPPTKPSTETDILRMRFLTV